MSMEFINHTQGYRKEMEYITFCWLKKIKIAFCMSFIDFPIESLYWYGYIFSSNLNSGYFNGIFIVTVMVFFSNVHMYVYK